MIKKEKIIVSSEDEAFKLLEAALNNELADKVYSLEFKNWPILEIKLNGKGYDSTITSDMAESLVSVQHAINRAYARTIHKSSNARTLTTDERQALQFKAKVEKGSSLIKIDLGEFAEKICTRMLDKMSPNELIATVVGVALVGGGYLAYKAFLKAKTEDKRISADTEQRIQLSQEETRRMEVMAAVIKTYPSIRHSQEDFDSARKDIVRSIGDADSITVNSLPLDQATAKIVGASKRSESKEVQLNGTYHITTTDHRQEGEVRLRVKRKDDAREFVASFLDHSLEQDQINTLQHAEWNKRPVYLSINATELRGEITTATIISATPQPEPIE